MNSKLVSTSKFLSLVLRHKPDEIELSLDENGWADLEVLLYRLKSHGKSISLAEIQEVVATSDKKRFAISEDGMKIRASQGHSVSIELGLSPVEPPATLFHGTATRFLESILQKGLISGNRKHVHLSSEQSTAVNVGQRHGKPVVLLVDSGAMFKNGHAFYLSENGVWLTENVPADFLKTVD